MNPTPTAEPRPGAEPVLPQGQEGVRAAFWAIPLFKTTGISVVTTLLMLGYFWALRHPAQRVVVMPLTPVDRWVGFCPALAPFYFSLWFYTSLCAGLVPSRRQLILYGVYAGIIGVVGLVIFVVWPTAVPAMGIDWRQYPSVAFLKRLDASGNACPSLHVAYAVYSAVWVEALLSEIGAAWGLRAASLVWAGLIVYSTMAIRQHVAIDVLLGAVLGLVGAFAFLRSRRGLLA